jgi:queuine tRNA-ribosyltransferase
MEFEILKKSKKSRARLGLLKTSHGIVETPSLVPVATKGVVKTLTSEEATSAGCQILIANTFHLHLRPGEKLVKTHGGLHKFMNWPAPLMTDSGGYQVFSLGFGSDFNTGKISKKRSAKRVTQQVKPKNVRITHKGVYFNSPIDGKKLFIGPKESIRIQESLGADIIFTFDECTPPNADKKYTADSLVKTHRWAEECLEIHPHHHGHSYGHRQSLFGIVQGGKYKDLRIESAKYISSLPFSGFGIGGEFGNKKETMIKMLSWVVAELPENKPRHLLGIGHLEDIPKIIKSGVDLFDCTVPTHYARTGIAFTSSGRLDMRRSIFLRNRKPLDKKCGCDVCKNYTRGYICHLVRASEMTGLKLLTFHNLSFFNSLVKSIREEIKSGKI